MENEYSDIQKVLIAKIEQELMDVGRDGSSEYHLKTAIVEYFINNCEHDLMHVDFLKALYDQSNSLDYMYVVIKDLPITRLINKASKATLDLAEILELVGDDAYVESMDKERMTQVDGHAYFIRKPENIHDVESFTSTCENNPLSKSSPYHVFETIELSRIKFDDFVNRRLGYTHQFIANHASRCHENKNGILQCIRVVNKDNPCEKILIQTEGYDYARYVAIEKNELRQIEKNKIKKSKGVER